MRRKLDIYKIIKTCNSKKIGTLLPSATEIVCALGLEKNLVGISHECDFPTSVTSLPKFTSSTIGQDRNSEDIHRSVESLLKNSLSVYNLDLDLLKSLKPDYLITQDNYYNLKFELTTDPLYEILYKFDIVIGSHQSAAHLDAYLAGFPVIIYLPDGDLNLSPLRGIHKIPIVNNRKTLIGALRSIHNGREGPKDCFFWLFSSIFS